MNIPDTFISPLEIEKIAIKYSFELKNIPENFIEELAVAAPYKGEIYYSILDGEAKIVNSDNHVEEILSLICDSNKNVKFVSFFTNDGYLAQASNTPSGITVEINIAERLHTVLGPINGYYTIREARVVILKWLRDTVALDPTIPVPTKGVYGYPDYKIKRVWGS